MGVDPQGLFDLLFDLFDDLGNFFGQGAAVGVAKINSARSGRTAKAGNVSVGKLAKWPVLIPAKKKFKGT